MTRACFLVLAATLGGCVGLGAEVRNPCENRLPHSGPLESTVFERRKPESPVAIGADKPRTLTVRLSAFDDGKWAEGVFDELASSDTLPLGKPAPVLDGALVCAFSVRPSSGIDGVDTPSGPVMSSSTPDLIVWAELGGAKFRKGPKFSSLSATFAFKVTLRTDDPIDFLFNDFDVFSSNDYVGRIRGKYPGKVPFEVRGSAGSAECRAASSQRMTAEGRAAQQRLEGLLQTFEAYSPTLEAPIPADLAGRIEKEIGTIEYFTGSAEPALGDSKRRVEEGTRKQWSLYLSLLRKLHEQAPAPGEWVGVDDVVEARVVGLHCQSGKSVVDSCEPELEVRLLADPAGALCPSGGSSLGDLGPIRALRVDGETSSAMVSDVRIGERWIKDDLELLHLPRGTVLRLPLFLGGTFWRKTHVGWDIPLLQVGKKYLRIY